MRRARVTLTALQEPRRRARACGSYDAVVVMQFARIGKLVLVDGHVEGEARILVGRLRLLARIRASGGSVGVAAAAAAAVAGGVLGVGLGGDLRRLFHPKVELRVDRYDAAERSAVPLLLEHADDQKVAYRGLVRPEQPHYQRAEIVVVERVGREHEAEHRRHLRGVPFDALEHGPRHLEPEVVRPVLQLFVGVAALELRQEVVRDRNGPLHAKRRLVRRVYKVVRADLLLQIAPQLRHAAALLSRRSPRGRLPLQMVHVPTPQARLHDGHATARNDLRRRIL